MNTHPYHQTICLPVISRCYQVPSRCNTMIFYGFQLKFVIMGERKLLFLNLYYSCSHNLPINLLFLQNQFYPYNGLRSRFRRRTTKTATLWWCVKERHTTAAADAAALHVECTTKYLSGVHVWPWNCIQLHSHTRTFCLCWLCSVAERTILYGFKRKCTRRSPGGRTGSVEDSNNGVVNWRRCYKEWVVSLQW